MNEPTVAAGVGGGLSDEKKAGIESMVNGRGPEPDVEIGGQVPKAPEKPPQPTTGIKHVDGSLNIRHCYACDGIHHQLEVKQFNTSRPPWTHWFICPTTGDAVPVTLVIHGQAFLEVNNDILRKMVVAQATGEFLVAIFSMHRNNREKPISMEWVSENFPIAEMRTCAKIFGEDLQRQYGPPAAEPMAQATPQKMEPLTRLFNPKPSNATEKSEA